MLIVCSDEMVLGQFSSTWQCSGLETTRTCTPDNGRWVGLVMKKLPVYNSFGYVSQVIAVLEVRLSP